MKSRKDRYENFDTVYRIILLSTKLFEEDYYSEILIIMTRIVLLKF